VSFPTTNNPANELMGRNLVSHVRSNTFVRIRRSAFDPTNMLPTLLQKGEVLVRGSTAHGKFHLQITALADAGLNSDALLFSMIPDIDQLDATLANQQSGFISITLRGESEMIGDISTSIPNASGRWINLSPLESDEFGVPRAFVQFKTTSTRTRWPTQWTRQPLVSRTNWQIIIPPTSSSADPSVTRSAVPTMRRERSGWDRIQRHQ
jgi:hypothetical protein